MTVSPQTAPALGVQRKRRTELHCHLCHSLPLKADMIFSSISETLLKKELNTQFYAKNMPLFKLSMQRDKGGK